MIITISMNIVNFFFFDDIRSHLYVSYPNFVRGLLLDGMQPLIDRFEVLSALCCTICEVLRRAGNQKKAWLHDP